MKTALVVLIFAVLSIGIFTACRPQVLPEPQVPLESQVQPESDASPEGTCSDSDGGNSVFTKGVTTTNYGLRNEDVCTSENSLIEYYCVEENITSYDFTCPEGCSNGACTHPPVAADAPRPTVTSTEEKVFVNKGGPK
jgi:hypothetical protein